MIPPGTHSLSDLAAEHLGLAADASSGRSSVTVYGGHEHSLRQTLIALRADQGLGDHQSPGEATLQVLRGRVLVVAGDDAIEGNEGDLIVIPDRVHSLQAITDAAVLLTVANRR